MSKSLNDKIRDADVEFSIALERLGNKKIAEILTLFKELKKEIESSRTLKNSFLQNTIDKYIGKMNDSLEIEDLSSINSRFLANLINGFVGVHLVTLAVTPLVLRNLVVQGKLWSTLWKKQGKALKKEVEKQLKLGRIGGLSEATIKRNIIGSKANAFKDGVFRVTEKNAKAIVRTGIQTISSKITNEFVKENKEVIKGLQQVSTLDGRTSITCIAYAGKQWDMKKQPVGHSLPYNGGTPRHFFCRSKIIPVVKSWKELGIDDPKLANGIPKKNRASMDGLVSQDITFDEWLRSKSPKFKEELLGKGRAELYAQGKITLTQLLSKDGKAILTIEQLKKRYS